MSGPFKQQPTEDEVVRWIENARENVRRSRLASSGLRTTEAWEAVAIVLTQFFYGGCRHEYHPPECRGAGGFICTSRD